MAREKSEKGTAAPPTRSSMPIPCSSRGHPDGGCASLPSTGLHSRLRLRFQLPLTSRGQLPDQDDHTMHHHHKVEKGRMTTKTSPPTSSHKFNQFAVFDVVDKVADIHAVLPLAVPRKLDRLLVRRVDKTTERTWERLWLLAAAVAQWLREEPPQDRERRDRHLVVGITASRVRTRTGTRMLRPRLGVKFAKPSVRRKLTSSWRRSCSSRSQ